MPNIERKLFREVDLADPFFDSLKGAYAEFSDWFLRKAAEEAYVLMAEDGSVQGFLYLKVEHGPVVDIDPPLNAHRVVKVGTFKINAHGTRLGERFVKKVFDHALEVDSRHIYVTVFPNHVPLIALLERYGFMRYGIKDGPNGQEYVYLKDLSRLQNDTVLDYPVIDARGKQKWLLSIYPNFHTRLFPDSILRTEDARIVNDISETNSISKVYVAWMDGMTAIAPGDIIVIYRTAAEQGRAWHTSVATSLCVVTESRQRVSFRDEAEFVEYCRRGSVFADNELVELYRRQSRNPVVVVRMTYNVAFARRPNMQRLVDDFGLARRGYWGFRALEDGQFRRIVAFGGVNEGVIIHQA